jgi:hypothetical protein
MVHVATIPGYEIQLTTLSWLIVKQGTESYL